MTEGVEALIAARLKQTRIALGMNQSDVAARLTALGVPTKVPAVSMVEAGRRRVSLTELATYIRALGGTPAREALLTTVGVTDPDLLAALVALGGAATDAEVTDAEVPADVQAEADRVHRDRQRERVFAHLFHAIRWQDLGFGSWRGPDPFSTPDDEPWARDLALDALEDLFNTRDVLNVREQLVEHAEQVDRSQGRTVTVESTVQARGWATRRMAELVTEELSR